MSTAYAPITSNHHSPSPSAAANVRAPAHASASASASASAKCVIHSNTVTRDGHVLVEVHVRQANGQAATQKYHVSPSKIQAFMQQQRQMHPYMQFVKHGDTVPSPRTDTPPQPSGVGVYDKYDMSYSSCHFDQPQQSHHPDTMPNARAAVRPAGNC
jgi:hypothetical protein